jgi:hypothetical protein
VTILLAAGVVLLGAVSAWADIITVDISGGADYTSIQAAINAADSGDTINVAAGIYNENLNIIKSVTISGAGIGQVTLHPATTGYGIGISGAGDNVTIEGMTIAAGNAMHYLLHVSHVSNFAILNVKVVGAGQATLSGGEPLGGVDLITVTGATISDVEVQDLSRNGVSLTDSTSVALENLNVHDIGVSSGWAGVAFYTSPSGTVSGTFLGTSVITNTPMGIYVEDYPGATANLNAPGGSIVFANQSAAPLIKLGQGSTPDLNTTALGLGLVAKLSTPEFPISPYDTGAAFYPTVDVAMAVAVVDPAGAEYSVVFGLNLNQFFVGPGMRIQRAINAANPYDTINVAAGTYTEVIVIDKSLTLRGATAGVNKNGYTVPANYAWDDTVESIISRPSTIPDPNSKGGYIALVDIYDVSNVTFEGFIIQELNAAGSTDDSLVRVRAQTGEVSNIVFRNNIVGPFTNATSQDGKDGRMGLYLVNNPYSNLYGIVDSTFSRNKIFDCKGNGNNVFIWSSYYAFGAAGPASMAGTVIEDNEIYGSHRSGIETAGGFSGLTIRNNKIYDNSGLSSDDPDALKYGNGILLIRGSGDKIGGPTTAYGPEDLTIENNDIYNNEKNGIYMGPINHNYTITGNDIYNNGWDGIQIDLEGTYWNPDFDPTPAGPWSCYDGTSDIEAHFNNISENTGYGVRVVGTPTNGFVFDATCNWWGAVNGPGSFGPGSGDHVSGHVDYAPWLTAPAPGGPCNSDTPRGAKLIVVDNLQRLLPTGEKKTDHRIEEAIKHINKSLDPNLWETDSALTKKGKKVFEEEKKAVHELMKIVKAQSDYAADAQAAIDTLVSVDALLAQGAIDEAIDAGSDPKEIAKAEEEMTKAQEELNHTKKDGTPDPHYDKAIDHYTSTTTRRHGSMRASRKRHKLLPQSYLLFQASSKWWRIQTR